MRDEPPPGAPKVLVKGQVYTISRVHLLIDVKGAYGIELQELDAPWVRYYVPAFDASRFRPIIES